MEKVPKDPVVIERFAGMGGELDPHGRPSFRR